MNPLTHFEYPDVCPANNFDSVDEVRDEVWGILGTIYPQETACERRAEQRFPYPYLVQLFPVDEMGEILNGDPVVVVGKHLSESGLGFYHPKPLPYRRMIAVLNATDGDTSHFLIDLAWCRFTEQGWYESGGRFLESYEEFPGK